VLDLSFYVFKTKDRQLTTRCCVEGTLVSKQKKKEGSDNTLSKGVQATRRCLFGLGFGGIFSLAQKNRKTEMRCLSGVGAIYLGCSSLLSCLSCILVDAGPPV
jgi:hypothetical protein